MTTETTRHRVTYCYRLQAWIEDGKVGTCGHATDAFGNRQVGCHACDHAGESHPADCPDCGR